MTRICPNCGYATVLETAGRKPIQLCQACNLVIDGLTAHTPHRWTGPEGVRVEPADPEYTHESLALARQGLAAAAFGAHAPPGHRPTVAHSEPVTE